MSTFQKEQLVWTQNAWISENKYSDSALGQECGGFKFI